jgi:hypothetical protein
VPNFLESGLHRLLPLCGNPQRASNRVRFTRFAYFQLSIVALATHSYGSNVCIACMRRSGAVNFSSLHTPQDVLASTFSFSDDLRTEC